MAQIVCVIVNARDRARFAAVVGDRNRFVRARSAGANGAGCRQMSCRCWRVTGECWCRPDHGVALYAPLLAGDPVERVVTLALRASYYVAQLCDVDRDSIRQEPGCSPGQSLDGPKRTGTKREDNRRVEDHGRYVALRRLRTRILRGKPMRQPTHSHA